MSRQRQPRPRFHDNVENPEIAALQDLLRVAWSLMSETQQAALIESDEAQALLAEEGEEE